MASYLIDSISEGVVQIDLHGQIVFVNNKLTEMSGYSFDEVIGESASKFLGAEGLKMFDKIIYERKKGISSSNILNIKIKSGSEKVFSINGAPVKNTDGSVIGAIGTFTEIFSPFYT